MSEAAAKGNEFSLPIRVYIEDTDAGAIVYYANYLKFMERCRTEMLRELGFDKPAMLEGGELLVVQRADIRYHRAARLDERLTVTARIDKLARTNVVFHQAVWRDAQCLCEGMIRIACVSGASMRPCPIPSALREKIATTIGS